MTHTGYTPCTGYVTDNQGIANELSVSAYCDKSNDPNSAHAKTIAAGTYSWSNADYEVTKSGDSYTELYLFILTFVFSLFKGKSN